MQVDPRHIHNTKRNVPPSSYKQCATPPKRRIEVSQTHLAQTHLRKMEAARNHPHQNVLVTRMQVKTQTNLDLWNTTLGYGFHIQYRNFGMFAVEDLAHYSERTLVRAKFGYLKGSPNTNS
jgi:hypothetical protein